MTLRVVWDKLNIEIPLGVKDGRPQYENRVLRHGAEIPVEVSDFNRSLYLSIGAAKDDGAATAMVQQATEGEFNPQTSEVVLTPEQPPNPTGPAGGVGAGDVIVVGEEPEPSTVTNAPVNPASLPTRPDDSARKDVWEDYAVKLGIDRPRAESLTKANLIKEADTKRTSLTS